MEGGEGREEGREAEAGGSPCFCGRPRSSARAGSCGAPWTPRTGTPPGPRCRSCRTSRCSPAGGRHVGTEVRGRVCGVGGGKRRTSALVKMPTCVLLWLLLGLPLGSQRAPLGRRSASSPPPTYTPGVFPETPGGLGLSREGGGGVAASSYPPLPQHSSSGPLPKSRSPGPGRLSPSVPGVAEAAPEPGWHGGAPQNILFTLGGRGRTGHPLLRPEGKGPVAPDLLAQPLRTYTIGSPLCAEVPRITIPTRPPLADEGPGPAGAHSALRDPHPVGSRSADKAWRDGG